MQLTENIKKFIAERAGRSLSKFDKEAEKEIKKLLTQGDADALNKYKASLHAKRIEIERSFEPANWLTHTAKVASDVSRATHAIKYSHSLAKGSSVIVTRFSASDYLITRSSLAELKSDIVSSTGAGSIYVANFLALDDGKGKRLLEYIAEQSSAPFDALGTKEQVKEWMEGFSTVLTDTDAPATHTHAKQLYFPINITKNITKASSEHDYHLLSPLFATALYQEIYNRLKKTAGFNEESKNLRNLKDKKLFSCQVLRRFPNLIIQKVGGSQPQNVSLFNMKSIRKGELTLFNAQPPHWRSQLRPPASSDQFWKGYTYSIRSQVKSLQDFLTYLTKTKRNNLELRNKRSTFIKNIVDELHNYAGRYWLLTPDWSAEPTIKLSLAERCWLDPESTDEAVVAAKLDKLWQKDIAKTFAHLLAQALKTADLMFADDEKAYFAKQMNRELNQFARDLEVMA